MMRRFEGQFRVLAIFLVVFVSSLASSHDPLSDGSNPSLTENRTKDAVKPVEEDEYQVIELSEAGQKELFARRALYGAVILIPVLFGFIWLGKRKARNGKGTPGT